MFNRNEINEAAGPFTPSRMHYPWHDLEEYQPDGGMWTIPTGADRARYITDAQELMAQPDMFRDAMRRALREWPKSCAVALSTPGLNRRAWLGHAGCYLATGSPEETTRLGWHELDDAEQYGANEAADDVIREWLRGVTPIQATLFPDLAHA